MGKIISSYDTIYNIVPIYFLPFSFTALTSKKLSSSKDKTTN